MRAYRGGKNRLNKTAIPRTGRPQSRLNELENKKVGSRPLNLATGFKPTKYSVREWEKQGKEDRA